MQKRLCNVVSSRLRLTMFQEIKTLYNDESMLFLVLVELFAGSILSGHALVIDSVLHSISSGFLESTTQQGGDTYPEYSARMDRYWLDRCSGMGAGLSRSRLNGGHQLLVISANKIIDWYC